MKDFGDLVLFLGKRISSRQVQYFRHRIFVQVKLDRNWIKIGVRTICIGHRGIDLAPLIAVLLKKLLKNP